jgi:hypothetical protein
MATPEDVPPREIVAAQQPLTGEGVSAHAAEEESTPMLEAHAPHQAIHTWADFFVHIATIVLGLLIAVGLEQTVEYSHHRHQRLELEAQMRETVAADTRLVSGNLVQLDKYRSYLVEVRNAIVARRRGAAAVAMPSPDDPRAVAGAFYLPSIAPYEAARESGTVALLTSERIRIFYRLALQYSSLQTDRSYWDQMLVAANSIRSRFSDSKAKYRSIIVPDKDMSTLSDIELMEYQTAVGNLIEATDMLFVRFRRFDAECRAFLDANVTEKTLIEASQRVDKDPGN